jgi:hypothetical protein
MNPDRDNPLLDACLDEVLGGRTPPDLTARILQAHAARRPVDLSVLPPVLPGPAPGYRVELPAPPPVLAGANAASNGHPVVELSAQPTSLRKRSRSDWQPTLVAASILGITVAIGVGGYLANRGPLVVKKPGDKGNNPALAHNNTSPDKTNSNVLPPDRLPDEGANANVAEVKVPKPSGSGLNQKQPPQIASTNPPSVTPERPLDPPPKYRDPSPDPEVISFVNATLASAWTASGVKPADPATDEEWCRRLFVRVLGRIPTVEELRPFLADRSREKRQKLVDRLLTDDQYVEEYATHWASVWSNVLIGRTGGRGDSLASREGMEQYLRQSLALNKPYDKLVHELLTATGSAEPGAEDYNGAVNFLLAGLNKDATLATARVSRVFLGHQLQCAQCHNHPTQDWSQQQYWALNSFLRQAHPEKAGDAVKLVNTDFAGQGQGSTDGEVYYETPTGLMKSAFPAFLDGTAILPSGELAQIDRRAELAKFVVRSEQLPRALVNRMWAHFFGYGFTQPVDDMSPEGNAAHPELLDRLAEEFAARNYDLKSLIRWIALSDPFGRSSKLPSLRSKDMPEAGEVALFSRYYIRQMPAEEVYNSLVQAAQIRKTAANEAEVEKARVDWLAQFNRPMGTDDADEESHFSGGIGQSLIMMNGDLMRRAASTQQAGLLKTVTQSKLKYEEKVSHLFLSALSREPTRRELESTRTILANSSGNEAVALEDIWWALLNSNEFILDH